MKVWNLKKMKPIYGFNVKDIYGNPNDFLLIQSPLQFFVYGKTITRYEYNVQEGKTQVSDSVGQMCHFIPQYHIFLVVVNNIVKVWNSLTGDIKKIYSNISHSDITAFNVDELGKRFILGNQEGFVGIYNVFNGAIMKSIQEHKAVIKFVVFSRAS